MTTKITEQNISQLANAGVNWQPVVTADGSTGLTAVAGRGYFIDTTSGAQTVTLPASPNVGDVVVLKDYARTWATNNVTIASTLLDGITVAATFSTSGQTVTLVRMDNTKGWSIVNEDTTSNLAVLYVAATGGTVTESGDFKIHTFTGDGCFVVSCAGNPAGSDTVDYLVVAGGGGGSHSYGGGGAGGFRYYANPSTNPQSGPGSPLNAPAGIVVTTTSYPVIVGSGGVSGSPNNYGIRGNNSVFSTITSTGGGGGNQDATVPSDAPGGSGGGGGNTGSPVTNGTGNTPPTSPPQGNNGGNGLNIPGVCNTGGGGGGAVAVGTAGASPYRGGPGGAGAGLTGFGTGNGQCSASVQYFSGGGGARVGNEPTAFGVGGIGGGGNGVNPNRGPATSGTANTGGGGGGGNNPGCAGAGGSGIVVIRYKFQ